MATEQAQLIGGSVTCQAVKPNYDIASFNETFEPNGSVEPVLIVGTGLWSACVGANWILKFDAIQPHYPAPLTSKFLRVFISFTSVQFENYIIVETGDCIEFNSRLTEVNSTKTFT